MTTSVGTVTPLFELLDDDAAQIFTAACSLQQDSRTDYLGVHHWLLIIIETHLTVARAMSCDLVADDLPDRLRRQIQCGDVGDLLNPDEAAVLAVERARMRGCRKVSVCDVIAVVLQMAGYTLDEDSDTFFISTEALQPQDSCHRQKGDSSTRTHTPSLLDTLGWDLTRAAREGKLCRVVERDDEVQLVIETLCRRTKRNPVLIGPAGVGKTAIVEALAERIVCHDVPELLHGARLVSLSVSSLSAGCSQVGQFEERMNTILAEASQGHVILFIDEVHALIGAGSSSPGDAATILKPALARGDIACIAATTDDEYRRFIEGDTALERRFQPVRVHELTPAKTMAVLRVLRNELAASRHVVIDEAILAWVVEFAGQYLRNRHFPDKGVDLLEQCVAYAVANGKREVTPEDAIAVGERMIGMPCELAERLDSLSEQLTAQGMLGPHERDALLARLEITVRGLDFHTERPNAVVLLTGKAAAFGAQVGTVVAESLFGSAERIVTIDFSCFTRPEDITMLLGSRPGYVGYGEKLALHAVAHTPWCVLCCENVHACHPYFLEVLAHALAKGYFTDSCGKRIYLSDTIVLLSAAIDRQHSRIPGFTPKCTGNNTDERAWDDTLSRRLGPGLTQQLDVICDRGPGDACELRQWLMDTLLCPLVNKYRTHGICLTFDHSFLTWLEAHANSVGHHVEWERLLEEKVSGALVALLHNGKQQDAEIILAADGEEIRIRPRAMVTGVLHTDGEAGMFQTHTEQFS